MVARLRQVFCVLLIMRYKRVLLFQSEELYFSLLTVHCENDSDLACSNVQCVPRENVCDGYQDCANGLDEYCGKNNRRFQFQL